MADGVHPARRSVGEATSRTANRADWDAYADEYQATHGEFLRDVGFVWCPEGLDEASAGLLGDVAGRTVLEVGCGAAQCARWLVTRGASAIGLDLSHRQLQHARRIDEDTGIRVPAVCGTATDLPFADASFDVVFCAFGAFQFVTDAARAVQRGRPGAASRRGLRLLGHPPDPVEHARRPDGGRPGGHLVVLRPDAVRRGGRARRVRYVEHHRTLGDWVGILAPAGFRITDLVEPEWPEGHDRVWGGWGPERGALIPGTAIFRAELG